MVFLMNGMANTRPFENQHENETSKNSTAQCQSLAVIASDVEALRNHDKKGRSD